MDGKEEVSSPSEASGPLTRNAIEDGGGTELQSPLKMDESTQHLDSTDILADRTAVDPSNIENHDAQFQRLSHHDTCAQLNTMA